MQGHGKREGRVRVQQVVEQLAVAAMRGVATELLRGLPDSGGPEPELSPVPSPPAVDGGLEDKGYARWRVWARLHGFEPEPPSGISGSTGFRFVTRDPPAGPSGARVLVWVSEDLADRLWVRH